MKIRIKLKVKVMVKNKLNIKIKVKFELKIKLIMSKSWSRSSRVYTKQWIVLHTTVLLFSHEILNHLHINKKPVLDLNCAFIHNKYLFAKNCA